MVDGVMIFLGATGFGNGVRGCGPLDAAYFFKLFVGAYAVGFFDIENSHQTGIGTRRCTNNIAESFLGIIKTIFTPLVRQGFRGPFDIYIR